jgi:voltage-gated potassium channel
LLIVPALILEDRATSLRLRQAAIAINWVVWLAFCGEYEVKVGLAPRRRAFVRQSWFDVLIILLSPPFLVPQALQGTRAIRAVRALRFLRFIRAAGVATLGLRMAGDMLSHRRFHYVTLATAVIVALGAIGIFTVEHGTNPNIGGIADAFWWAMVTVTTVGYGDVSPVTPEGRLIAVALMIVGTGFIGVFTATITSFFFDEERAVESTELEKRLDRIEAKLDAVIRGRQGDH